ncbi:hypothetical protein ACIQ9I_37930 [Streptomyces sp. NPDC094461]|uniref:hypothetical protein n=1 Tax=unclassified Streptomyces TaxID=2593676 RepID=UPI00371DF4AC
MTLGEMLQRHAGQAVVATAIISEAVMTQLRGPAVGIAVGVAATWEFSLPCLGWFSV